MQTAVTVFSIERRQNHISQVDPNHSLLPIALDYLKDVDNHHINNECPSAHQLSERVAALKETVKYKEARERVKDRSSKEGEYEQLYHVHDVIDQKYATIMEKEQQLRQCKEELTQQNQQIQQQRQRNTELEEQLGVLRSQVQGKDSGPRLKQG